ncbi:MAG: HNH/ENDO VII family nuclease [Muribaculaceae bacterium]|nr:HNH/ENDO VII family nuclease [Muribaculaceae bacterium]
MENYSKLQKQTGWSDEIFRAISSEEEAQIYIKAGLKEKIVNGRYALINPAINGQAYNCRKEWLKTKLADYDSWKDWTNADLVGEGYPPRDDNGDPYELHHIGQKQDSPFAELSYWDHMTDGNNAILHPKRESEIDRRQFEKEKAAHWMARYNDLSD